MNSSLIIPRATLNELANPAPPGARHSQMVKVARALASSGAGPGDIFSLLRPRYGPDVPDSEIHHISSWASGLGGRGTPRGGLGQGGRVGGCRTYPKNGPKKALNMPPKARVEAFLKGFRCSEADLWEASPFRLLEDWRKDGSTLISTLYQGSELVNVVSTFSIQGDKARPAGLGTTLPASEWASRLQMGFESSSPAGAWIRMNPLDGEGIADLNVVACRFALLECDALPVELQLSLVAVLPLPISAILTSGGRSVHAWVRLELRDLDEYRSATVEMLEILEAYGFDGANKNPSRLSRFPGVERTLGALGDPRQRLLYLNPNAKSPTPIFSL